MKFPVFLLIWTLFGAWPAVAKPGDQHQLFLLRMRLSSPTPSTATSGIDLARVRLAHRLTSREPLPPILLPTRPVQNATATGVTLDSLEPLLAEGRTTTAQAVGESQLRQKESPELHRFLCRCALSTHESGKACFHLQHGEFSWWETALILGRILLIRLWSGELWLWFQIILFFILSWAVIANGRSLYLELNRKPG